MPRSMPAISILALVAISASLSIARAADVTATSKIETVTVYPTGAEVTRAVKVKLEPGEHAVLLNELPAGALPQSIRVEGKATGGQLQISSVDTRRVSVPRADSVAIAGQRRSLEDQIEKLKDQRLVLQADVVAAEAQKAFVENLTKLPTREMAPGATAVEPDWTRIFGLIGDKSAAAQRSVLDANVKIRDLDRQIEELNKKLATLAPAPESRTEVKVFVSATATADAEFVVRYQVASASWTPFYDARLATATKSQAAKLQMVRRASIQQRSGESWNDVALTLSTTRPAATTAAPDLQMLSVDFEAERPPVPVAPPAPRAAFNSAAGGVAEARSAQADGLGRAKLAASDDTAESERRDEAIAKRAQEVAAAVETQGFQVLYGIPGRVTVMPTGEQKRVQIGTEDLDPALIVRTVPRLDPLAYLYAKLILPKTSGPVLPGAVSLFRDGTFVGQGQLPQLASGEEHELGFGADDQIKVKRVVIEDKKGESGVFTTSRAEERNFTISVKNLHANSTLVQVLDRVPVSMHQDIKVETTYRPQPTRKDVNDRRGTVAWDLTLAPDQESQIAFGYKVSAPAGKPMVYRELSQRQIQQSNQTRF